MSRQAPINEFTLVIESAPIVSVPGAVVTPGNNTYGSYVQLLSGAAVLEDAYGIWINVNSLAVSGQAKDAIARIGVDPAGGTSYTAVISDLAVPCANGLLAVDCGISYYFPLRIRAGSSVAIAVSVNNATPGTCSAICRLYCRPTRPGLVRAGTFVRTFGSTPGSSTGTSVTVGNDVKGSYVQLGSALTEPLWYWVLGICSNQAAQAGNVCFWDLAIGDATNKRVVIASMIASGNVVEAVGYSSQGMAAQAAVGDLVYGRGGGRGGAAAGWSMIAYGVGG